ncbi:NUDIX hydrolase [Candidatus Woesearchaeota archaeon]|nr:NUDIX hydrolase [Candidatus Woesearchaeota archaeon]
MGELVTSTWEMVALAQPGESLDVRIAEGKSLHVPLKRAELAVRMAMKWEEYVLRIGMAKQNDILAAIQAENTPTYRATLKHIGGIRPLYRCSGIALQGTGVDIHIGLTDFYEYAGTNIAGITDRVHRKLLMDAGIADTGNSGEYFANPFSACAAVVTSEGDVLLGRRSGSAALYPNALHVLGGTCKPPEKMDITAAVLRELQEEMGITGQDIREMHLTGIVRNRDALLPEAVFVAYTSIGKEELGERWRGARDRREHSDIIYCSPEQLVSLIPAQHGKMVPAGEAAVCMYLREKHPRLFQQVMNAIDSEG